MVLGELVTSLRHAYPIKLSDCLPPEMATHPRKKSMKGVVMVNLPGRSDPNAPPTQQPGVIDGENLLGGQQTRQRNPTRSRNSFGNRPSMIPSNLVIMAEGALGLVDESNPTQRVSCRDACSTKFTVWCVKGQGNPAIKLVYHLFFTIFVCVWAINRREHATTYAYYLSENIVSQLLKNEDASFVDIRSKEDVWKFLKMPFSDLVSKKSCTHQNQTSDPECYAKLGESLWVVDDFVFTQLRVKPTAGSADGACRIPSILNHQLLESRVIKECYLGFKSPHSSVDTKTWMNESVVPDAVAPCFKVNPGLSQDKYQGYIHLEYDERGHYDCTQRPYGDSMRNNIALLEANNYLDIATRVFYIDFALFSPSMQAFATMQLSIEHLPSGNFVPYYTISVFGLLEPSSDQKITDYVYGVIVGLMMVVQFVAFMCRCYYAEASSWCMKTIGFLVSYNLVQLLYFGMYGGALICELLQSISLSEIDTLKTPQEKRELFSRFSYYELVIGWALGLLSLLTVLNTFKYLKISKHLSLIILTAERSAKQVTMIVIAALIVLFAYALAFYLVFGVQVKEFRSVTQSLLTCVSVLFVDVDLRDELASVNRVLGPVLLITYMFFAVFVVISMILAVVEASFDDVVKERAQMEGQEDPLVAELRRQMGRLGAGAGKALHSKEIKGGFTKAVGATRTVGAFLSRPLSQSQSSSNKPLQQHSKDVKQMVRVSNAFRGKPDAATGASTFKSYPPTADDRV